MGSEKEILRKIKEAGEKPGPESFSELARILLRYGYPGKKKNSSLGTHEFSFKADGILIVMRVLTPQAEEMAQGDLGTSGPTPENLNYFKRLLLEHAIVQIGSVDYRGLDRLAKTEAELRNWNSSLLHYCFEQYGKGTKNYEESLRKGIV